MQIYFGNSVNFLFAYVKIFFILYNKTTVSRIPAFELRRWFQAVKINLHKSKIVFIFVSAKTKNIMATFKVTMVERQKDGSVHTIEQTAVCSTRKQVMEWYVLNEPDIVSYKIEEEK